MQKLIDTVNSFYATGIDPQAKIFKLGFGQYQDRAVVIYPQTPSRLVYVWADPPYLDWSDPAELAADSADYPPSAHMDSSGNVYLAYTQQSSLNLLTLKMTFSQGCWTAGAVNVICNVGENYFPSMIEDSGGRLWVSWTHYDPETERYLVHSKTSQDDGATWGTGPSDPGISLTNGTASCFSQLLFQSPYVHCFYSDDSTLLAYRSHHIQSSGWDPQQNLYSGSQVDYRFCADLSADNRVGIVFPGSSAVLYREFDGSNWTGVLTVDICSPLSVAVKFLGSIPYVFFVKSEGEGQNQLFYSYKDGSSFASALVFELGQKTFDRLFCYDDSAASRYTERTAEAADTTPADVFHPSSGGLVKDLDDALYLGMAVRFNQTAIVLSTAGIGGQVSWQYWDGQAWTDFSPQSGAYHLDSQQKIVVLWPDLSSVPNDWQMCPVNGESQFWVRLLGIVPFSTAPVGTQITALSQAESLKVTI
jgi:hypothetical protein